MRANKSLLVRLRVPLLVSTTILCAFILLGSDQGFGEDQKEIIDRGVEIKIEEYIKRQDKRCWDRALEEAVSLVDSMVRAGAMGSRIDPVVKPPRPYKPGKPEIKQLPDSLDHSKVLKD
ncbi:MAG: hypothetical protein DRI69_02065 [Bacteroidetes bacterium]|nr:MAG: hypothetical protein DRI69_02065 [Bacteroidota bacterium]